MLSPFAPSSYHLATIQAIILRVDVMQKNVFDGNTNQAATPSEKNMTD